MEQRANRSMEAEQEHGSLEWTSLLRTAPASAPAFFLFFFFFWG